MPAREIWEAIRGKSRSVRSLTRMIEFKASPAQFHSDFVDRRPVLPEASAKMIPSEPLIREIYVLYKKYRQPRGGNWLSDTNVMQSVLLASCHKVRFIDYSGLCFMGLIFAGS